MTITSIGKDLYQIPHVSGEVIKASASALEMPCFLGKGSLKPILQMTGKPIPKVQGDKVVTANNKLSIAHFATPINSLWNEWGGLDQIITLFSKPDSNTLIFDYDSTNLVPYHQPPLTPTEIAEGSIRSDHVINSLAWYHTSKGGTVTPSDVASRITTGKAQHWYRQLVTDAKGNKSWADWIILNGSQVGLVLDDKFMSTAVYPVVIAPVGDTFGFTGTGGTSGSSGDIRGCKFTAGANSGTSTVLSIYVSGGATDNLLGGAIYSDVAGVATIKLAEDSGNATAPIGGWTGWTDVSISQAISANTAYWLMGWTNITSIMRYDAGNASQAAHKPGAFETWPSPYASIDYRARKYSIYCTYTPAAGAIVKISGAELLGLTESPIRRQLSNRLISETEGITDSKLRRAKATRLFGEVVGVTDSLLSRLRSVRLTTETVGISELSLIRMWSNRLVTESIGVVDSLIKRAWSSRFVQETIGVLDDMLNWFSGIPAIVKMMAESLSILEDTVRRSRAVRAITETVNLADSLIKRALSTRFIAEVVGLADTLTRRGKSLRQSDDTIILNDGTLRQLWSVRAINEIVGVTDNLVRRLRSIRLSVESIAITDSLAMKAWLIKIFNETIGIAESALRRVLSIRMMVEQVTIQDAMLSRAWLVKMFAETINLRDDMRQWFSRILRIFSSFLQALGITPTKSTGLNITSVISSRWDLLGLRFPLVFPIVLDLGELTIASKIATAYIITSTLSQGLIITSSLEAH